MILDYMVPRRPQTHITEPYVSSPPALIIVDETGAYFTLGFGHAGVYDTPRGEFAFNVLRNGRETGTWASRIERRNGRIRAFTREGWRIWNGRSFT
jgi:beta-xylosidase